MIENKLKPTFKVVENIISDEHVECSIKYDYKPKNVQSPLTNIIVHDLETFRRMRVVPYCGCKYELSKNSGKYHRDISKQEYLKCLNDCIVFKGTDCINEMLDNVSSFKGETNLPQWPSVVSLIKNGASIVSLKIFNAYVYRT